MNNDPCEHCWGDHDNNDCPPGLANYANEFPHPTGYKTQANARRVLQRAVNKLASEEKLRLFVHQRDSDKRWLPVALLTEEQFRLANFFINNNVCVTDGRSR